LKIDCSIGLQINTINYLDIWVNQGAKFTVFSSNGINFPEIDKQESLCNITVPQKQKIQVLV